MDRAFVEQLPVPWDMEGPMTRELLVDGSVNGKARFHCVDPWHVLHLGVGKSWVASGIMMLERLITESSMDKRIEVIAREYQAYCKLHKLDPVVRKIDLSTFGGGGSNEANGSWSKAAVTSNFMLFLQDYCERRSAEIERDERLRAYGTERINFFMRGIYKNEVFMDSSTAAELSKALYEFVRAYLFEASAAAQEGKYELGDEYVELKGDLLHDVLGGYVTPEMEKLLAEVKAMRLLDGLVNRKTGEVEFIEDDPKQIEMIKTVASVSQEHDQLKLSAEEEVSRLEQQQQRCERKLKKAKEEMELARKGQGSSFFSYDPKRIQKLEQHVRKTTRELQDARQHLLSFDDEVARAQRRQAALDSLSSNAEGAKSAAQSTAPVVRKPVTTQYSEFAGDLLDTVYEVGDEYVELKGDLLRDMLGGSLAGARTYLESRGDPNVYDSSTGWTPLLMAVSSGHTQLVDLLLQCKADPAKGAKSTGETAVHLAVYRTSGEVLQQLLNFRRQCVQDVRQDGSTALMLALERSPPKVKIEYVRSLLEKNADPNVKRKDGWSALGLAIRANMRPATKMMIAVEGKVLSTVPGSQLTLWELAEQHKDLQKLIKSKLSSKNLAEIEKRWPGTLLRMQIAD
ncbi:unnamed protein product [Durusdinium trenchii]|uniref:Uncharacterized protein n=1 Tax=Durusdinium trenchii TaxID=1381693 RepID=A0ABP0LN12_9DINO